MGFDEVKGEGFEVAGVFDDWRVDAYDSGV